METHLYPLPTPRSHDDYLNWVTRQMDIPELTLPFWGCRKKVSVHRIVRLEGEGNYSALLFNDGSRLVVSITLKKMATRLAPELFVRSHKKNIINLLYLKEIHSDQKLVVTLANGDEVEVSRRKAAPFLKQVQQFQQRMDDLSLLPAEPVLAGLC